MLHATTLFSKLTALMNACSGCAGTGLVASKKFWQPVSETVFEAQEKKPFLCISNDEQSSRTVNNDMDKAAAVCSSSAAASCSDPAAAQQQLQEPATAWSCVCSGKNGVRRKLFALADRDQTFVGGEGVGRDEFVVEFVFSSLIL